MSDKDHHSQALPYHVSVVNPVLVLTLQSDACSQNAKQKPALDVLLMPGVGHLDSSVNQML